jgi:RNA polymerase sigma-70 factor (ECF subfamily)
MVAGTRGMSVFSRAKDEYVATPMSGARTNEPSIARRALAHADSLYRLARHLVRTDAEAEDLVQETFARALGGAETFREGSNLRAWLHRILRNAHIDLLRRRRANPVALTDDPSDLDDVEASRELLRDDREVDALRGLVAADIARALAALSDDARTIVLLDHEGFTESELAEIFGCPHGTVKSKLSRARAALRVTLAKYGRS